MTGDADKSGEILEAVLVAVEASLVGEDGDPVVDVEKLVDGLVGASISVTATTNRGSLISELSFIRTERRTVAARCDNAENAYDREELEAIVKQIDAREDEIQTLLWK